ncbi:RtcB family protein, partial [Corallococcus exercitus]
GGAVGEHHQRVARALGQGTPPALRTDTEEGQACVHDLDLACRFARANRDVLGARALAVLADVLGVAPDADSAVDVHHNHVASEPHFGRALWGAPWGNTINAWPGRWARARRPRCARTPKRVRPASMTWT